MRSVIFFITVLVALFNLAGCSPEGNGSGVNNLGIEQGNGMVPYTNSELNISFSYPQSWTLTETQDRMSAKLSNEELIGAGNGVSFIEFERILALDGQRVKSLAQLKSILEKLFPESDWKSVEATGRRKGYMSYGIVRDNNGQKNLKTTAATYYILDENYNILRVAYKAFPSFGGEELVYTILGALFIDRDPPELFEAIFEPREAAPGDEVTLRIVAIDDSSGMDGNYFSPPSVWLNDFENSWIGYDVAHRPLETDHTSGYTHMHPEGAHYYPASAYPFRSAWTRISKIRFEYKFKIPVKAPAGTVVAANISLSDARGNRVQYTLEPFVHAANRWGSYPDDHNYLATYETRYPAKPDERKKSNVKAARLRITGSNKNPPRQFLTDAYWDKSLMRPTRNAWGGSFCDNTLKLNLAENTQIVASSFSICRYAASSNQCSSSTETQSSLTFSDSEVSVNYDLNSGENPNGVIFSLSNSKIRDEYGNIDMLDIDMFDLGKSRLGKPVLTQVAE